jgi:hypothetical protein
VSSKLALKEFHDQIASLRSQLQASRDKQGVFVDPSEFYAMEQRIASQTNHISECESTIRHRETEIKNLSVEKAAIEQALMAKEVELFTVRDETDRLFLEIDELASKLQSSHERLIQANTTITEYEQVIASNLKRIEQLDYEVCSLQEELSQKVQMLSKREQELQDAKQIIVAMRAEIVNKQNEIDSLGIALRIMTARQQDSEERLKATYVQLKARERIIQEQTASELLLTLKAKQLQETVLERENEISQLLLKIDELRTTDKQRIVAVDAFADILHLRELELRQKVDNALIATQQQTEALETQLSEWQNYDHVLCQSLHQHVEGKLALLVSHSETHRDELSNALTTVTQSLTQVQVMQRDRFNHFKGQWNDWTRDVQQNLNDIRAQLQLQHTKVCICKCVSYP